MAQPQVLQVTRPQLANQQSCFNYKLSLADGLFIRYLVLQAAEDHFDDITCTIYTCHLDHVPAFEAVSYVWGTLVQDQSIKCNGKSLAITANLLDVLRQVRHAHQPRTLWVDSICINQSDAKEKGHQVSLMGHIYKRSQCTLICLGTLGQDDARLAATLVADIDHLIQGIVEKTDFDWTPNSFPFADENEPLLKHEGWGSFTTLLQQPWFRRGWVVQEAALGPNALILWAGYEIDWLALVRSYIWCIYKLLRVPSAHELWLSNLHLEGFYTQRTREAVIFRPEGVVKPLSCLEILEHARWLEVTDPRDRIYGFMSLLRQEETLPALQPSYEVPYLSLYHQFASELLIRSQDLDILHFVHHDENTLEDDLPSWVPRWNVRLYSSYTGNLNNYHRDNERFISQSPQSKIRLSEDQTTLQVGVVLFDSVAFKAQCFDKKTTTDADVVSLWHVVSSKSDSSLYPCPLLRAFVEIFRCGIYRGRLSEWNTLESAYMKVLQGEISTTDGRYSDAAHFHRLRMEDVHNKSFFLSDRGYYGLAPKGVQEGDLSCFIFGTRSPFILRKTNTAGHYKLVGSVLILGRRLDHNGNPDVLGMEELRENWTKWDLKEEKLSLC